MTLTRHSVMAAALVGVLGAGTATLLVHGPAAKADAQELCIVFAKDAGHHNTQDYCIDWTAPRPR